MKHVILSAGPLGTALSRLLAAEGEDAHLPSMLIMASLKPPLVHQLRHMLTPSEQR